MCAPPAPPPTTSTRTAVTFVGGVHEFVPEVKVSMQSFPETVIVTVVVSPTTELQEPFEIVPAAELASTMK